MESRRCLNCSETIEKRFCPNCGQKADTHRITIRHFLAHDLLHGVWHLEKGILFTLKETVVRPGKAALDYIKGKRIRYYNLFYLCLLVIAFDALIIHFFQQIFQSADTPGADTNKAGKFISDYAKFFLLGIVPILALNAKLVFRKLKLNLAEHFILGGISLLGMLITSVLFLLFNYAALAFNTSLFDTAQLIIAFAFLLYPIWVYANAMKGFYSFGKGFALILCFSLLVYVQLFVALGLIINKVSDGSGEVYLLL